MIVLKFGWSNEFIMPSEDALKIIQILEKSMMYEEKYRSADEGGTTYHVYPITDQMPTVKLVSNDMYDMAKLAGKPDK